MRSQRYKLPNQIDLKPAAKRQIDYAASLGISLPKDAAVSDASALINRVLDDDTESAKELREYAAVNNIMCSEYVGNKYLHNLLFDHLEKEQKAAFFCFCIYKFYIKRQSSTRGAGEELDCGSKEQTGGAVCENMYKHKDRQVFEAFGEKYANDFYFTVSMDEYYGEELVYFGKSTEVSEDGTKRTVYGGSIHTTAFKKAYQYLQDCDMLPKA